MSDKACSAQISKESFEGRLQAGEALCFTGTVQGNFAALCASSLAASYIFLVLGLPGFCCYRAVVQSVLLGVREVNVSCRKFYTKAPLLKIHWILMCVLGGGAQLWGAESHRTAM